jgi:5'-nucleotidase
MPVDLSHTLVIGVSSRALFDLEDANRVFDTQGVDAYARYQMERVEEVLAPGAGFPLIKALLQLNKASTGPRKAEVVIMSRNSPATSLRMFHSIRHYQLDILRAALAGGASLAQYLLAFDVDLFLSAHDEDVRAALSGGIPAARIYPTPANVADPREQIRIAFDADAVLFSAEAERIYRERGLAAFLEHEVANAQKPLPEGPFAKLLRTLSDLQADGTFLKPPIRIAVVSARNMPAHERVIRTLLAWKVRVDEAFFMGGVSKTKVLEAFAPHIFFDDQEAHCAPAAGTVPTARVFDLCDEPAPPRRRRRKK